MQQAGWDAIIVNFNGALFLDPCLRALVSMTSGPSKIIVVDNASTDDSISELAGWPQADVLQMRSNLGYAGGANAGAVVSEAPILVFLNPDVELDAEFGRNLIQIFSWDESLGAAGSKLIFPDSKIIQHAGGRVHWPELTTSHVGEREPESDETNRSRDVDYVTGAALAVRRSAFDEIGGFDDEYFPAYWEDVDLCYRLRGAEWRVRFQPELTAVHHEGAGQKRGDDYYLAWTKNRLRFAMNHLSGDQWWREFIPAEVARLRGELSVVGEHDWVVRSGVASIEQLARAGYLAPVDEIPVTQPDPLIDSIGRLGELHEFADPRPRPIQPSDGVMRRLKRFLSRLSGRIYAEEFYWQQRQFNDAVVRAFKAQDRLNREHAAQLVFALLLIGRIRSSAEQAIADHGADSERDVPSFLRRGREHS